MAIDPIKSLPTNAAPGRRITLELVLEACRSLPATPLASELRASREVLCSLRELEREPRPVPSKLMGVPVVEDLKMPPGAWELRDRDGNVLAKGRL